MGVVEADEDALRNGEASEGVSGDENDRGDYREDFNLRGPKQREDSWEW
jgi:hypothetical protein